ncbi:MAG TPA: hypothetical protein VL651_16740 [Bacteroidia bacterium]|jgi:hypothetical protein|nr:hypothetical protein [Bacteroidia bacterium]
MKKFIIASLLFIGLSFTFTSCGKYVDGPKISLLTKKMRVTGHWTLNKYYDVNGNDITTTAQSGLGSSWELQIEKDGSYKSTGNVGESGTWKLGEDKDDIIFTPSSGTEYSYRILRLKNKEMWLRITNPQGLYEKMYLVQ